MQAKVLSENEQKKTLSSNKKSKKSIKTALLNYKIDLYTSIDQTETEEIAISLGLLRKAKLNKLKIPHNEYKNLPAEEIKSRKETFLNQEERKFFVQNRKFLVPGLNSVSRQLHEGKISCVILTNVEPSLLNHHIINSCKYFKIPYVVFPSLKKLTKNYLGFKTICLGFKKEVEDSTNLFNPIFKKISDLTPLNSFVNSELPKDEEQIENSEKSKSSIISKQPETNELEINFDEIYCKRNSKKRTFHPPVLCEDKMKSDAKQPVDNYFSSPNTSSLPSKKEVKTKTKNKDKIKKDKDGKIYKKVKLTTITKQKQKTQYLSKNITLK